MINLKTGITNSVIVHASQMFADNLSRDYAFRVLNVDNEEVTWFTNQNISPATKRYDEFEVILSGTPDVENGVINLERNQYTYEVYQLTGSSLTLSATTGVILETGKLIVDFEKKSNYITNDIYI
jgi:hypothetical protein